jgi:hypothetical protein
MAEPYPWPDRARDTCVPFGATKNPSTGADGAAVRILSVVFCPPTVTTTVHEATMWGSGYRITNVSSVSLRTVTRSPVTTRVALLGDPSLEDVVSTQATLAVAVTCTADAWEDVPNPLPTSSTDNDDRSVPHTAGDTDLTTGGAYARPDTTMDPDWPRTATVTALMTPVPGGSTHTSNVCGAARVQFPTEALPALLSKLTSMCSWKAPKLSPAMSSAVPPAVSATTAPAPRVTLAMDGAAVEDRGKVLD